MMQNHVIYSDDPQAVEKLQAKLDKLTAMHARMKEINAYFRKHATAPVSYTHLTLPTTPYV